MMKPISIQPQPSAPRELPAKAEDARNGEDSFRSLLEDRTSETGKTKSGKSAADKDVGKAVRDTTGAAPAGTAETALPPGTEIFSPAVLNALAEAPVLEETAGGETVPIDAVQGAASGPTAAAGNPAGAETSSPRAEQGIQAFDPAPEREATGSGTLFKDAAGAAPEGLSAGEARTGEIQEERPSAAAPNDAVFAEKSNSTEQAGPILPFADGTGAGRTGNKAGSLPQNAAQAADGGVQRAKQLEDQSGAPFTDGLAALYGGGNVVVRVSQAKAATAASPALQVAKAAAFQIQNGKSEFQMELYPESLGKVSVRLTAARGMLTVEIAASDPKTQSLLLSGSEEIRSILQASTGQAVQTVLPDGQTAGWWEQPRRDGGGNDSPREKQKDGEKDRAVRVTAAGAGLDTGSFLGMIRSLGTLAR